MRLRPGATLLNTAPVGRLRVGLLGHYATNTFPDDPLPKLEDVTLTIHNTPEAG